MLKCGVFKPWRGDDVIQLVMAQVGCYGHPLQLGLAAPDLQGGLIQRDVQRHSGAVAPFLQCVALHHRIRQHGDLVAWHVDGGQAGTTQSVNRIAGLHGQAGRGNMHAHGDCASAQTLYRQRVINFGGGRVVNRKCVHRCQR